MYNIFLSLFISITVLGILFFIISRNKKLTLKHYLIITVCAPFLFFFVLVCQKLFFPLQFFSETDFEKTYSQVFDTKLPSNTKYIATKYKEESGLLRCRYWTARIQTNRIFFTNFLNEIKGDGWEEKDNFKDITTGKLILSSFRSRYMSGFNYEVDFFNDSNTLRIYIIDCP